jgi:hypothetical protein
MIRMGLGRSRSAERWKEPS